MAWHCQVEELVVVVTLHPMQGVVVVVPRYLLFELCQSDVVSGSLDLDVAPIDGPLETIVGGQGSSKAGFAHGTTVPSTDDGPLRGRE